jgi:hypothetical protein
MKQTFCIQIATHITTDDEIFLSRLKSLAGKQLVYDKDLKIFRNGRNKVEGISLDFILNQLKNSNEYILLRID